MKALELLQYLVKNHCLVPLIKTAIEIVNMVYVKITKK